MLDRESLHALARRPEDNDPALNEALAEEGDITVLLALAGCMSVGPDALARVGARVAAEGEAVGHVAEPEVEDDRRRGSRRREDEEPVLSNGSTLDARLVAHPRADDAVRDAVLERHADDPFFALAAATHPRASARALDLVARWPASTPLHDRTWLGLLEPRALPPMTVAEWARDESDLAREAAARVSADPALLDALARDPSRRVRRAVAGNAHARPEAIATLRGDPACEVRARAEGKAHDPRDERGVDLTGVRFKAAVASMGSGGTLASDVVRAMRAGPLDPEGARLAARALDDATVAELVVTESAAPDVRLALAAGVALRRGIASSDGSGGGLVAHCVRALADADRTGSPLAGKGRLAAWLAEGLTQSFEEARAEVLDALAEGTLAADRMVLGQVKSLREQGERFSDLCGEAVARELDVPVALLELAWRAGSVPDETLVRLAARTRPARSDGALEQEADLDPRARPLPILERVAAALAGRSPLAPRAALALVAAEPRRVRYILSALPQWKGVLTGANVARVLKAHAGALTAAGSSGRRPSQAAAGWTQRKLDEVELAIALAVGDLSPAEAHARLASGQASLVQGPAFAAGMEARATLDGAAMMEPLVELLARERSRSAAALSAWLLVEGLDRARSPTAIAAALDAPWVAPPAPSSSRSMVPVGLSEGLATLERRDPGRLRAAMPQTPRGRAALASGIARAYRALGGMSVDEH